MKQLSLGFYIGIFSGILPLYLAELSPKNLQGSIGSLNQLLIVIGVLVTNIFGLKDVKKFNKIKKFGSRLTTNIFC
jgi:hypothetical protein